MFINTFSIVKFNKKKKCQIYGLEGEDKTEISKR